MRAVERAPWAERRSSRHDEICALIAKNPRAIAILANERQFKSAFCRVKRARIEVECGTGYCDVLLDIETEAIQSAAIVVEVKTDNEGASVGDTIRQLKWYRRRIQESGRYAAVLCCVCAERFDEDTLLLFRNERFLACTEFWLQKMAVARAIHYFLQHGVGP